MPCFINGGGICGKSQTRQSEGMFQRGPAHVVSGKFVGSTKLKEGERITINPV